LYTKYIFQYLLCRFEALKPAVDTRKGKLQDSLHFHQFKFDADEELQWIKEHLPAASSTEYGKSLITKKFTVISCLKELSKLLA
jgi:hypothetical protein